MEQRRLRIYETARTGAWTAYSGHSNNGTPLCGARTRGSDRSLHLKYFQGDAALVVHVFKNSWRIPPGVDIPITFSIDRAPGWTATAIPLQNGTGIEFSIGRDTIDRFEALFRAGQVMRITFLNGNENEWAAQLRGSNQIASAFVSCMRRIENANQPTQAISPGHQQPSTTQPYSAQGANRPRSHRVNPAA